MVPYFRSVICSLFGPPDLLYLVSLFNHQISIKCTTVFGLVHAAEGVDGADLAAAVVGVAAVHDAVELVVADHDAVESVAAHYTMET